MPQNGPLAAVLPVILAHGDKTMLPKKLLISSDGGSPENFPVDFTMVHVVFLQCIGNLRAKKTLVTRICNTCFIIVFIMVRCWEESLQSDIEDVTGKTWYLFLVVGYVYYSLWGIHIPPRPGLHKFKVQSGPVQRGMLPERTMRLDLDTCSFVISVN